MSINDHIRYTRLYSFEPYKKPDYDNFHFATSVNNWSVTYSVDQNGKLSISASKTFGKSIFADDEPQIKIEVQTATHGVPQFRTIYSVNDVSDFVEVNDGQNRQSESFEQKQYGYKRQYIDGSIVTSSEFFSQIIPNFKALLKDTILEKYVSGFSESLSKNKPSYKPVK